MKRVTRRLQKLPRQMQTALDEEFREKPELLLHVTKWLLLASLVGAVTGAVAAAFLYALDATVSHVNAAAAPFIIIPVALALNVLFLRYILPKAGPIGTNSAIATLHRRTSFSPWLAVRAFIAPILTIAGGGSVGKEAPAADVGSVAGTVLGFLFRFDAEDRRKLAICGISAGFAAVIGAPIAGALFGVEVLFVGSLLYSVLLPAFVAGIVGYGVATALGAPMPVTVMTILPEFSTKFFLTVALSGVVFGVIALAFIGLVRLGRTLGKRRGWTQLALAVGAGLILATIATTTSTQYLGLGSGLLTTALAGEAVDAGAPLLKTVATSVTMAGSGSGGLITPVLVVGATAGSIFGAVLSVDPATFAAIGAVALLAAAMNTPIAASVLAVELFGPAIAPFAALACIIAFSMTGHKSVYPAQIHVVEKVPPSKRLAPGLKKKLRLLRALAPK